MTRGNRVGRFRELKNKLQLAISGLSAKSYFNLLIFRNLREVEMFGKTILPADSTNKSMAIKWLNEIGEPYENKQAASIRRPNDSDIVTIYNGWEQITNKERTGGYVNLEEDARRHESADWNSQESKLPRLRGIGIRGQGRSIHGRSPTPQGIKATDRLTLVHPAVAHAMDGYEKLRIGGVRLHFLPQLGNMLV